MLSVSCCRVFCCMTDGSSDRGSRHGGPVSGEATAATPPVHRWRQVLILAIVGLSAATQALAGSEAVGDLAFSATSLNGGTVDVRPQVQPAYYVVCFLGAECPMARVYAERLEEMSADWAGREVTFIGVNSNRQDSIADVRRYVDVHGVTFAFVKDKDNVLADRFGATRTPEVFVLDQQLNVRYRGRIDDQYAPGVSRHQPQSQDLRRALEELTTGQDVSTPSTEATGCLIGRVTRDAAPTKNDVTYAKDVVPVLNRHCRECHRDGEIGPFAMSSYDEVAGWADTMMETIDNGRMPPWHADPQHGDFANARHMTDAEKQTIRDWIAGGTQPGDLASLPPAPTFDTGWQLGREPDKVVAMRDRPFVVPRDGVVEYQYYVADPGFTEDTWVTAAQVRPGARSVVHHAIVFIRPPDGTPMRGVGWLSSYVPGQRLVPFPPGRARLIPAGSRLVFQMHYTPSGKQVEDITEVGLYLANDPSEITHEVVTLLGLNQEFTIPPGAADHRVEADVGWLPDEGELLGIAPHMHFRGRSFRVFEPGRKQAPLLSVNQYDFNWQHTYVFERPLAVRDLAGLRFEAGFDNSPGNPFNPNPDEFVTWGDQTWEEMAVAFYEVSMPRDASWNGRRMGQDGDGDRPPQDREQLIADWMKLDANGDGRIVRDEAPIVVRFFTFGGLDRDDNDAIDEDELRRGVRRLFPRSKR